ncbi:alpha/beta hydrolase [uncultured Roseovarius sp.]|uniref:alpha/beta hydrolase n=1 Tax=uncultured Roseovarius sp. TaxID=293344 RepID=UPI002600753B|nr:alpha/beta hydrolase [uncultured Roseovarius sp.]
MLWRLALVFGLLTGGAWFSLHAIERAIVYPFDATRIAPATAGVPEMQEVERAGLVVWEATAKPGQPTIFYLHGNAGNLANRAGRFSRFMARGYGVIAPAYPGSSGSAGTPSQEAITKAIADIWRDLPQDARVVIYGESLGTGVAVQLLGSVVTDAENGLSPAGVILEAPFTSVHDVARHLYPGIDPLLAHLTQEWASMSGAAQLTMPLLVVHGQNDQMIPPEQGRALFEAAASDDKRFLEVPGAGHTDLWRSDTVPELWTFINRVN